VQPAFCLRPVAPHCARGYPENLCRFFFSQSSEESAFYDATQSLVDLRELDQCFVDRKERIGSLFRYEHVIRETHSARR
jgi:hypothetical protein